MLKTYNFIGEAMLEIINNALRNNNYYICLYKNNIYLYNYKDILSFNNNLIMIKFDNFNLKIKGSNMLIKHMQEKELIISGNIIGVFYE